MNLQQIYKNEGADWLNRMAEATRINRKYLYQCASGRRRPSPDYAKKMICADNRLTLDDIYSDQNDGLPVEQQEAA